MEKIFKKSLRKIIVTVLIPFAIHSQTISNIHKFVIENITIEGNTKTKDYVIFENLPFYTGDSLNENEIVQGINHLNSLEIFSNVTMQPKPGGEPGKLDLRIIIEERYWPHFRFQGGYSELDGWYLTPVSLNMDNIFGYGNFISLDLTLGDRLTAINLNYINPNIFDSDLDFITKLSNRALNFVHYIDDKRWILPVIQGSVFVGFRSREEFFRNFTFGFDFYTTKTDTFAWRYNSDDRLYEFPYEFGDQIGNTKKGAVFSISFKYDQRDQSYYPASGWWLGSRIEFSDTQLGSEVNFTKFTVDIRKYNQFFGNLVAASRLKFGLMSFDAPFYEKFYLGGPNSLRGFEDRSLSPLSGGNQIYQAGIELRFPITQKNFPKHFLSGVVFVDTGTDVHTKEMFKIKTLDSAYGFGLRLRLPFIGIVRMDIAKPMNGEEKRIQFSLGHTF